MSTHDTPLDLASGALERFGRAHDGGGTLSPPGIAAGEAFLAAIVTTGPSGEADLAGPQYWVRRQGPDPTLAAGQVLRVVDEPTPGIVETVPATNLCELPSAAAGTGTHLLGAGLVVLVREIEMQKVPPARQYVFAAPIAPVVVRLGAPRSAGGEYDGVIETGAATGMPPAGLADGPACIAEYLPEAGGTAHQLAAGAYYAGIVIGAAADGTPLVAVDAGVPLGNQQYQVYQMTSASTAGWDWVRAH